MYSSWAFANWLHGVKSNAVDLVKFIDQELARNYDMCPGWSRKTMLELFQYEYRPDKCILQGGYCSDCNIGLWSEEVKVQPYWRHSIERIKQSKEPDYGTYADSQMGE